MFIRAVHAPPIPPFSVALGVNARTRHDNVGHVALGEVRAHLACANPSVGEDDYPRAASTRERVVAPNGLDLCEYFRIAIARTVRGEFEREVLREAVQPRGDETCHSWVVDIKVSGKGSGNSCGGEY